MSKTEKTDPEMTHLATKDDMQILKHLATKEDMQILKHLATKEDMQILKHLATKEDMQRLNVWILGSSIGVVFTLVLIGLGAYRIFVG